MQDYVIKNYRKGVEQDQARIGYEAAKNWIWPYAYDLDDLLQIHARPDFDPQTRQFCYLGDKMVRYMFSIITFVGDSSECHATLDFPRVLPGHEQAADLMMEKTVETLKKKGVSSIAGRVTTMCPAG